MRQNDQAATGPAEQSNKNHPRIASARKLKAAHNEARDQDYSAGIAPGPLDIPAGSPNVELGIAIAMPNNPNKEPYMKSGEYDFRSSTDHAPVFTPKLMSGAMMVMAVIVLGLYGAILGAQLSIGQAAGSGIGSLLGLGFALMIRDTDRHNRKN